MFESGFNSRYKSNSLRRNPLLAFLAAILFLLAGGIDLASGLLRHGTGSATNTQRAGLVAGAMFACVGLLWLAIGITWKRAEDRDSDEVR